MARRGDPNIAKALKELIADARTSLTKENVGRVRSDLFRTSHTLLSHYHFWSGTTRRMRSLWEHQTASISLATAYLCADKRLPAEGGVPEAALIKMPTGTGKSGVVAVLSRCLPKVRRVLILAPRVALADQLRSDIRWRFWQHLGFPAAKNATFVASTDDAGAELEPATVIELLPSAGEKVLGYEKTERLIAVGTFQALEQLRREAESSAATGNEEGGMQRRAVDELARFDLVIVDEGHYEPAPKWSRAVRDFALPTILLSATPYRNDYKSFRLRGNFVFNYSWEAAHKDNTIRSVDFAPEGKTADYGDIENPVHRFVSVLRKTVPDILERGGKYMAHPKVIVRADQFENLNALQSAIEAAFGDRPVVIHHQIKDPDRAQRRFRTVAQARALNGSERITFWLHEWKLLEGIDDDTFVAIALYDSFTNARQLVQQVGRALRTTDKTRRTKQRATVIVFPEEYERLRSSWKRYEDFERYAAVDPRRLVQAEAALPDKLLSLMPELQYLAGEFRPRFAAGDPQTASDFRLPASAAVYEVDGSFDTAAVPVLIEEALLAEDRFKPLRIEGLPANAIAYAYYGWRSSPFLSLQFFPEWTLGVCILVHVGQLLFVHDTGGIVFDADEFGMRRTNRGAMSKLMPQPKKGEQVRIARMAAFSLDVSERAIRSMAIRTTSLADTFSDLLDPVLVPTTTFGFVGRRGRYLGLSRARVTDSFVEPLPLPDYCAWVENRAKDIMDEGTVHNSVFDRYAGVRDRLDAAEATPLSILLDVDETLTEFVQPDGDGASRLLQDVEYDDLCADVTDGKFQVRFEGKSFDCSVKFNETTQRYSIESAALDSALSTRTEDRDGRGVPITAHLNREQAFRIIVQENGVIYAHRRFFVPRTDYVRPDGSIPLLDRVVRVEALDAITTEKGEKLYSRSRPAWRRESIFGLIHSMCSADTSLGTEWAPLYKELQSFDTIVCDDDGKEIGDFLAISERTKRVALIHAKAAKKPSKMSVQALQEVGRQALASLAFCSAVATEAKIAPGRWGTPVNANGTILTRLSRVFRNESESTVPRLEELASRALANRSWNREIWIVAGRLMERSSVEKAIRSSDSNQARQYLMYLESLITSCARANSNLRIFCN